MRQFQNLGRFVITEKNLIENREAAQAVMAQCIPVRAEQLWAANGIEYVAISEHFDEVPLGQVVPEYQVNLSQSEEDGPIEVTFTKR